MKTFSEARKMYDGGRAAKTGWNCGDCGAEKNRSDQCRSCGSPARHHRNDAKLNPHLQKESSSSMDRMADTWNDHADHKHPKVQKHIKKAEAAYNKKDHEGFFHHTQRAADHAHTLSQNKKKFGLKEGEREDFQKAADAGDNLRKFVKGKKKLRDIRRSANMPQGYENLKAGHEPEGNELTEDYSDHKKNKYQLYSDDKTGHPNKKAHDDIHKAVTHPSGELKHVEAAQKKHSKHGAEDTASREQIHKHFTKHHADKEGKTWSYVKENKIVEMVSGFRKGDESVSKKGTLHKSSHITQDRDGGKVADALNKHDRLKTIKKAHKKLLQKEGYFKSIATKNAEKQRLTLLKKSKENIKKTTTVAKPNRGMAEENLDELSMELMGRHARAAVKQTGEMQKLKDNPKTPSAVKKAASNTIKKRSKGLDKTFGYQNEEYDTPAKKKPVSQMTPAEKKANDKRRNAYNEFQKKNVKEDLASGRPAKKPVSSNLLKQRAKENEKALATGFMKLTPKERAKESKRLSESARDNYNPEISDKRTKEKLKKAGLPPESPKVMEAKKPIVHFKGKDSLKTVKIKYNKPIRTKVTDIGPGGKEVVRKDWSEEYGNVAQDYLQELSPKTISSYQKKAGAQYRQLRKDGPTKRQDVENAYHQGYTSDKEYNKQHDNISKMKKRGRGLAASKGKGLKEEQKRVVESLSKLMSTGMKNIKKFQDSDTAKQIRQKKTTAGVKPAVSQKKR